MAQEKGSSGAPGLNLDSLLERVLIARPDAGAEDVKRLAPAFREVPEKELIDRIARMKQRIAAKSSRKRKFRQDDK